MRGETHRQLLGGHDLAAHQIGKRHLRSRYQVKRFLRLALLLSGSWLGIAALPALPGREQVFLELGQLPGAAQGLRRNDVGRVALGIAVLGGLHVEHVLGERAVQSRHGSAQHREARTGKLGAGFEIEPQRCPQVDVIEHREFELSGAAGVGRPTAHFDVAVGITPRRYRRMGNVGNLHQQVGQRALHRVVARDHAGQFGAQPCRLGQRCRRILALALGLPDRTRERVAPGLQVLGAGLDRLAFGFQRAKRRDVEYVAPVSEPRGDAVEVLAKQCEIKHGESPVAKG